MKNQIKFEYIKRNWELRDGIVYSRRTGKPISFAGKDKQGHRFTNAPINGKQYYFLIHEAVFVLFHDRPVAENKEIHHKDGDPENNAIDNLVELTKTQHKRIHKYQTNDPMRGIYLQQGAWCFRWLDDNGRLLGRSFHEINEAMAFRDEIERPRRQELRALGLQCKRISSGEKSRATKANKFYFSRSNANL
ncbi:HNH endonuclease signature motif containing protein [Escherichia coli]|uniref:HNH endonuclease signature motif containing protein n=3 Tax=Escherichia coli TaxID=562 RepID=UPI001302E77F|nr:HNH endonuclease signature motif containing protein [Escherichia coli]ELH6528356.1 HNH endonuclease [Escherichia coli]ELH6590465.1 HNH endonuclease [Escherichia coli]KAE9713411.1 HNH endonuclease [Escherichia coli]KAE9830141.1 HNH endonuclease [Escherichia coli]